MRHSFICTKCESHDVIEVKGNSMVQSSQIALSPWSLVTGKLNRYICANCGYTEEYVEMTKSFHKWADKELRKIDRRNNDLV